VSDACVIPYLIVTIRRKPRRFLHNVARSGYGMTGFVIEPGFNRCILQRPFT
jgi:hypothetical protein